jgi:hypothetical protein
MPAALEHERRARHLRRSFRGADDKALGVPFSFGVASLPRPWLQCFAYPSFDKALYSGKSRYPGNFLFVITVQLREAFLEVTGVLSMKDSYLGTAVSPAPELALAI